MNQRNFSKIPPTQYNQTGYSNNHFYTQDLDSDDGDEGYQYPKSRVVLIPKPAPDSQSEGRFSNVDPWEAEAVKMNNQNIFSRLIEIETKNAVLVNKIVDETRKTGAL